MKEISGSPTEYYRFLTVLSCCLHSSRRSTRVSRNGRGHHRPACVLFLLHGGPYCRFLWCYMIWFQKTGCASHVSEEDFGLECMTAGERGIMSVDKDPGLESLGVKCALTKGVFLSFALASASAAALCQIPGKFINMGNKKDEYKEFCRKFAAHMTCEDDWWGMLVEISEQDSREQQRVLTRAVAGERVTAMVQSSLLCPNVRSSLLCMMSARTMASVRQALQVV